MQNFKLILSYDGSRYFGWQRQAKTEHTIQGKLEHILSRILDEPIEVAGSGRHRRRRSCSGAMRQLSVQEHHGQF